MGHFFMLVHRTQISSFKGSGTKGFHMGLKWQNQSSERDVSSFSLKDFKEQMNMVVRLPSLFSRLLYVPLLLCPILIERERERDVRWVSFRGE